MSNNLCKLHNKLSRIYDKRESDLRRKLRHERREALRDVDSKIIGNLIKAHNAGVKQVSNKMFVFHEDDQVHECWTNDSGESIIHLILKSSDTIEQIYIDDLFFKDFEKYLEDNIEKVDYQI